MRFRNRPTTPCCKTNVAQLIANKRCLQVNTTWPTAIKCRKIQVAIEFTLNMCSFRITL